MKNKNLYYRVYRPEKEVKCALFVVHGMQEHQKRYTDFARYMNEHGVGVVTYDLPGHGESAGGTGDLGWFGEKDGWKTLVDSAYEMAKLTKQEFPAVPVYYFGHSMGTMIGRCFLAWYDDSIDGCILSGIPNYNPGAHVGKALAGILSVVKGKKGHDRQLDQLATGSFNKVIKNPRTPVDWLSYNTANVDAYIADPYCGQPFTIQGYHDLFDLMIHMHEAKDYQCTNKQLPILIFAGEDDPCIGGQKGFEDSVSFLKNVGYENINSRLYPHRRHETLQEANCQEIMDDILAWISNNN